MARRYAPIALSSRARSMLVAAAEARAEVTVSCEPDLYIDGLPCCDQFTARQLWHAGLVRAATPGNVGQRVRAALTTEGLDVLSSVATAA